MRHYTGLLKLSINGSAVHNNFIDLLFNHQSAFLKNTNFMGRILGLDIGDVRIGIAISDELEITAQGLQTFKRKYLEKDIEGIKDIIESSEIKTVIVGLPKMLDGTIGVQAQKVIDFTNILKTKINVPVIFWDVRLLTSEVSKMLINANVRRSKRREVADILSAQLILQGYLDRKRIEQKPNETTDSTDFHR